jgi:putative transposase
MARLPRLVVPGQAHYLILRGHDALHERGLCADEADRVAFIDALREAAATEGVQVHAFAVLAHEFQLLATPSSPSGLGRLVQALGRRYVSAYNRRYQRSGTLWDGRFRCAVVEPGAMRLAVLQLIDGLSDPGSSGSTSHRTGGLRLSLVSDPPEVWGLGNTPFEREASYRDLLAKGLPSTLAASLRLSALGGWAIGASAFVAELAQHTDRPARPRPRGRPRIDKR